jgi:DNA-binding NarL/FixJ family response regulator
MKTNLSILIIDDSSLFIHRLQKLLTDHFDCLSITVASCFDDGLSLYHQICPDLVFLDINLPGKSGIELLIAIRKTNTQVTIVMLTNNDPAEYLDMCLRLGANYYVEKITGFDTITGITDEALKAL